MYGRILLGTLLADKKLDIVDQQGINTAIVNV